jgi:hypothetical protein
LFLFRERKMEAPPTEDARDTTCITSMAERGQARGHLHTALTLAFGAENS